jgi:hypothetical protein
MTETLNALLPSDDTYRGSVVNSISPGSNGSTRINVKIRFMSYWSLRFRNPNDESAYQQSKNRRYAGQARNFFWAIGAFFGFYALAGTLSDNLFDTRWIMGNFVASPLFMIIGCAMNKFIGVSDMWYGRVYQPTVRNLHFILLVFSILATTFLLLFPFLYADWQWEDDQRDSAVTSTLHRRAAATCRLTLLAWPTTLAMLCLFGLRFRDLAMLDVPFLIIYPVWFTNSKFYDAGDDVTEWENMLCISYGILLATISISVARSSERKYRELFHEKGHLQKANKQLQLQMEDPFDNLNILSRFRRAAIEKRNSFVTDSRRNSAAATPHAAYEAADESRGTGDTEGGTRSPVGHGKVEIMIEGGGKEGGGRQRTSSAGSSMRGSSEGGGFRGSIGSNGAPLIRTVAEDSELISPTSSNGEGEGPTSMARMSASSSSSGSSSTSNARSPAGGPAHRQVTGMQSSSAMSGVHGPDPYDRFVIPANEFDLRECIGAGAAGTVYKALWMSGGGCEVAVKRIRIDIPMHNDAWDSEGQSVANDGVLGAGLTDEEEELKAVMEQIEDVRREAKALSKLSHPHLVGFYGICIDPPFLSVVTELMDGSLRDAIYSRGRGSVQWTPALVRRVIQQIVSGLSRLHSSNIVHRDLKPGTRLNASCGSYASLGSCSHSVCCFHRQHPMLVRPQDGQDRRLWLRDRRCNHRRQGHDLQLGQPRIHGVSARPPPLPPLSTARQYQHAYTNTPLPTRLYQHAYTNTPDLTNLFSVGAGCSQSTLTR